MKVYFTVQDSVKQAFENSGNLELKAELYLLVCSNSQLSKDYRKAVKKILKLSNKIEKLLENGLSENDSKIIQLFKEMVTHDKIKENCISEAKNLSKQIEDVSLISKELIKRYIQGFVIVDWFKGVSGIHSPYGRMVYEIFDKLSSPSLFETLKKLVGISRKDSYLKTILKEDSRLKDNSFLDHEKGALLIESHFMIFLIELLAEDLSEQQLKELLDEIASAIGSDDLDFIRQLKDVYRDVSLTGQFSVIMLQIIRLAIGKGVFMNAAVKITNVILRIVTGRGLNYARNAVLRKLFARFLGTGPAAIIMNIVLFIPDIASLVNRRDYFGIANAIVFLYLLRNEQFTSVD